MIHIWHEDSNNSSTQQFWNFLKQYKVHSNLEKADIQGFNGNSEMYRYLMTAKLNRNDTYHIFIDSVKDNNSAYSYFKNVKKLENTNKNIKVHNLLCFEYLILKFKYFIQWTTPMKYNKQYEWLKQVRKHMINCIDNAIPFVQDQVVLQFIVKQFNINTNKEGWLQEAKSVSSERAVTKLLSRMTNGGTIDFGVSKTRLGNCWTCNCCNKYTKTSIGNIKCRMYKYKKTSLEKAMNLWNNTLAKEMLTK